MQPLKIVALVIGALPFAAFVLTLHLTDGAPLKPLTPGTESEPVAATRALPQDTPGETLLERQGRVAAAGFSNTTPASFENDRKLTAQPSAIVNHDRDALLFMTLFGVPNPYQPPAP